MAWVAWVAPRAPRSLRPRLVELSDEAAERVARDEQLALELDACRRRGVVWVSSHCSMALRSYVYMAVYLCSHLRRGEAR